MTGMETYSVALPKRLLAVAAHPDDEVLGAGGLIHRVVRSGGVARILILSEGCSTQYPDLAHIAGQKMKESRSAAQVLGATRPENIGLPDMALSLEPPAAVSRPIERVVAEWAPDWVVTHWSRDLNSDHRVVHEATRVACRGLIGRGLKLLSYEVPSSTEYGYSAFEPNLFVRLNMDDLDAKTRALCAYKSEARAWPHGRSAEALRSLAHVRGYQSACDAAEAYAIVWEVL